MTITALGCQYQHDPLGLGASQPRLSWKLESGREGARQTAYRIRAARSPEPEASDLWDSGRIESSQTTHIEWAGASLASRQRVFWRVEVEDETGAQIASEVAHFEMGLLESGDWQANWIGGDLVGSPQHSVPAPFLRRGFELEKPVKTARLYASALGIYECHLNGARVGDQVFAPGWTDYRKRVQYQTYDVISLLRDGENALGAILGDGWYCGRIGWKGRQNYGDSPRFLAQLEIEFEDGEMRVIGSDEAWKFAYGPVVSSDWMMGESYDARLDFPGWSAPGFDDAKWRGALVSQHPELELSAPLGPPVRAIEEIVPVAIQPKGVVDFGQNLVGRVRLKASGPRGTTIKLRFAETLKAGPGATTGAIYTENLRSAAQTDYFTLSGAGEEVFEPFGTFHGFRFVEVSGFPGELTQDSIVAVVLHSDTPRTGDFSCSDPLINQLQSNIDWGQRGNFLDIPTDCPQRDERLGWTGDAQAFIRTAAFNRDVAGFFTEWARDLADAQSDDGGVPCVVPNPETDASQIALNSPFHDGGPAWADATLICPWTIYRCYGDTRILQENFPTFERYLDFLQATARDFIRCAPGSAVWRGFGDWLALDGSGQTEGGTPKDLLGTAFFAHDAALISQICTALGKTGESARYQALFENVKAAFNARFVAPSGLIFPGTQTAFVLGLHFDLLPENLRQHAADALARDIETRGHKLTTGFTSSHYLCPVLTRFGHLETAYALLHQTSWPSWLYAVTQGATTIWERWNGWTHDQGFADAGMNSFNHYAYGAIGEWLYGTVAGIELDPHIPGYARFLLAPKPGGKLTGAAAHLDTLHGRIESAWETKDGNFKWSYTVPPNTSAQITAPNGETFEKSAGKHFFECAMPK